MAIRTFLRLSLVLALVTLLATTLTAQDDGDDASDAVVERVIAALEAFDNLDLQSYTGEVLDTEIFAFTITLGEEVLEQSTSLTRERIGDFTLGDDPNGSGTVLVSIEQTNGDQSIAYDLEAEMRYVDGVLYVNAVYADPEAAAAVAPTLPDGWVVVEDVANFFEFAELDLDVFVEAFNEESDDDEESEISQFIAFLDDAESITISEDEIAGTAVEVIEFGLGIAGFNTFIEINNDADDAALAFFDLILNSIEDDSEIMFLTVALEPETDTLFLLDLTLDVAIEGADASVLDPSIPAGALLDLEFFVSSTQARYNFNEDLGTVEAPDLG